MEIRAIADRILSAETLDEKLALWEAPVTDHAPGAAERRRVPGRPRSLQFAPRRTAPAMPAPALFNEPAKRAVAHHIMANHELQALEVMAFVLRAFPDAPSEFRRGLLEVMADEQRHTRMHIQRAASLGLEFGALPVNSYFWNKAQDFTSVLDYLAGLPLTFEGCNLDHTLEFEQHFLAVGDRRSAAVIRTIHRDEIRHVAFGIAWLRQLKPADASDWDVYVQHLHWPLRPAKAIGARFHRAPRLQAGLSEDFVRQLETAQGDDAPIGDPSAP